MNINWETAPKEAQWYCPETEYVYAAWFYKKEGIYYACFEGSDDWFEEEDPLDCHYKEFAWVERPKEG